MDEKLKKCGLEENNACGEKGESIPGGCFSDDETMIYDFAPYACNCLIEVASYAILTVGSVDTTLEKEPGVAGKFVSVWGGGLKVSSPCHIDFESGMVTIITPSFLALRLFIIITVFPYSCNHGKGICLNVRS